MPRFRELVEAVMVGGLEIDDPQTMNDCYEPTAKVMLDSVRDHGNDLTKKFRRLLLKRKWT
jgi:hypothetical protein